MSKKFIKRSALGIPILFMSLILGCANEYIDVENKPKEGQSKQEIVGLLGNPNSIEAVVKKNDLPIFGPLMGVWDKMPKGTRMEILHYDFSDGYLSIYFVKGVKGAYLIAFTPKGTLY